MSTEPLPTRAALIQALKDNLASFEYLSDHSGLVSGPSVGCINDAIAQITQLLSLADEQQVEKPPRDAATDWSRLYPKSERPINPGTET